MNFDQLCIKHIIFSNIYIGYEFLQSSESSPHESSVRGEFTIVLAPFEQPLPQPPSSESYLRQLRLGISLSTFCSKYF